MNLNFDKEEIEQMRVECYRHWVTHFGTPSMVRSAGWNGCWEEFPKYGWENAEDELVVEYWVKQVRKVQV